MSSINELFQKFRKIEVLIQLYENDNFPLYRDCKLRQKYSSLKGDPSVEIDKLKNEMKSLQEELVKRTGETTDETVNETDEKTVSETTDETADETAEVSSKNYDSINGSNSLLTTCKFCDNAINMNKRSCSACDAPSMDLRRRSSGEIFKSTIKDISKKRSTDIVEELPDFNSMNESRTQTLNANTIPSICEYCNSTVVNGYCDSCNTDYNNAKQSGVNESSSINKSEVTSNVYDVFDNRNVNNIWTKCNYCDNKVDKTDQICNACDGTISKSQGKILREMLKTMNGKKRYPDTFEETPDFDANNVHNTQPLSAEIPSKCEYCDCPVINGICTACSTDYNKENGHSITKNINAFDGSGTQTLSNEKNEEDKKTNKKGIVNLDVESNDDFVDPSLVKRDLRTLSNIDREGNKTNKKRIVNSDVEINDDFQDPEILEKGSISKINEDRDKTTENNTVNSDVDNNYNSVDPLLVETDLITLSNIEGDGDRKNENETVNIWFCKRCYFENEGFEICKMCDLNRTENEIRKNQEININNQHCHDDVSNREIEKVNVVDDVENGSACDNNIDTWGCGECKYENNGGYICKVCDHVDEMRMNKSGSVFTWKCRDCNQDIKEDICPLCGKVGPKFNKWICETCGFYNDLLAKECEVCGRKNDNIKLCSGCENVYIHNSNLFCNTCSNIKFPDTDIKNESRTFINNITCDTCHEWRLPGSNSTCGSCLDKINKLNFLTNVGNGNLNGWECGECRYKNDGGYKCVICNHVDNNKKKEEDKIESVFPWECTDCNKVVAQSICPFCDKQQPLKDKWICKTCSLYNDLSVKQCEACGGDVEGNKTEDNRHFLKNVWKCKKCKHENDGGYKCVKCDHVDNNRKKEEDKQKSAFTWKCKDCQVNVTQDFCHLCGEEGPKLTNWICETCGLYNDLLAKECGVCGSKNNNIKLCSGCRNVYIQKSLLSCPECLDRKTKEEPFSSGTILCGRCKNVRSNMKFCQPCWNEVQRNCKNCEKPKEYENKDYCYTCWQLKIKKDESDLLCKGCGVANVDKPHGYCSKCNLKCHKPATNTSNTTSMTKEESLPYSSKLCGRCKKVYTNKKFCEPCWNVITGKNCKNCEKVKENIKLEYCYKCWQNNKHHQAIKKDVSDLLCKECGVANVDKPHEYCRQCNLKYQNQVTNANRQSNKHHEGIKKDESDMLCKGCNIVRIEKSELFCTQCLPKHDKKDVIVQSQSKMIKKTCKQCGSHDVLHASPVCQNCLTRSQSRYSGNQNQRKCWKCLLSFDSNQAFCTSCGVQWKEDTGWIKQRKQNQIVDVWRCAICHNLNDSNQSRCNFKNCDIKRPGKSEKLCIKCNLSYLSSKCPRCGGFITKNN